MLKALHLLSSCCTVEESIARSDPERSGAKEGGTTGVHGASGTQVFWQLLGLLVRAGVEESMVSELLSFDCCGCIVLLADSVPKISRARKSVGLDRSSFRVSSVVPRLHIHLR